MSWRLWLDRRGRFSWLRAATLALLALPGCIMVYRTASGTLGARPLIELNHVCGLWTIRFLLVTLAITPLRQILRRPELLTVRRMLGVGCFVYAVLHVSFYVADEKFDLLKVASEIVLRIYLTIGFLALAGLVALAATSTDSAVRWLGGMRWRRLHQAIYLIGLLGSIHFFLQSKADVTEATWMGGLFLWLMAYRILPVKSWGIASLLALAVLSAAATAGGEAFYFWVKRGIDPSRILGTDLTFALGVRPAQIVLGITLVIALLRLVPTRLRRGPSALPAET